MSLTEAEKAELQRVDAAAKRRIARQAREVARAINEWGDALSAREKLVLTRYYALDGKPRSPLRETAAALDISCERTRQLRNGALEKIGLFI